MEKYNIWYSHYIDNGDTDSYNKVVYSKPRGNNLLPIKTECIGHGQKHLGTRLQKIHADYRGKYLVDEEIMSGKGRYN